MRLATSGRSSRRWRGVFVAVVVLVGFPGMSTAESTPQPAAGPDTSAIVAVRSGDVAIVDVFKRGVQLPKGGSAAEFSLEPPADAVCPGDSEHDSWRVQTFLAPAAVDPGAIEYGVAGPVGEHQYAVFDTFTAPIVDMLTVPNPGPGLPARIDVFAPMSFAVFPPGELPDGPYRIGVACTYFGKTANYWDTEIIIAASPSDEPAQLTWQVPGVSDSQGASDDGSNSLIFVSLGVLAAAALGWFVWHRNTRTFSHTPTTRDIPVLSKERK
jgi:hypothetical protein